MVTMTVFINDGRLGDRFIELRKAAFKECFSRERADYCHGLRAAGPLDRDSGHGGRRQAS